jgi:hypothetical protein
MFFVSLQIACSLNNFPENPKPEENGKLIVEPLRESVLVLASACVQQTSLSPQQATNPEE